MDLGELGLVPMMEAHMPPWALMLMWRIPEGAETHPDAPSSVTGTVTWHVEGGTKQYTGFELQLDLPVAEVEPEATPSAPAGDSVPEEVEESP